MTLPRPVLWMLLLLVILSLSSAAAESGSGNGCVYYFYGIDCTHCERTDAFLQQLKLQNLGLEVHSFEVYYNKENYELLQQHVAAHSIPRESVGVPLALTSAGYFIGDQGILTFLENHLQENPGMECPSLESTELVGIVGDKSPGDLRDTLTFSAVTGAALKHSLTPGALAFIIIILMVLISTRDLDDITRKSVLMLLGAFLGLFLFGMGYLSWFGAHANAGSFFSKLVGLGGVIAGVIGISRFFTPWRTVARHIPAFVMQGSSRIFEILFSSAGVVVVGFVVSLFSLADAGRAFLSIRVLITDSASRSVSIPLLIFYILVFLVLAIVVTVAYYFIWKALQEIALKKGEFSDRDKRLWAHHMHKLFRLGLSVIALLLGLVLLFF